MKQLTLFLIVGCVLLFMASMSVGYVWFKLQYALQTVSPIDSGQIIPEFIESEDTPIANVVPKEGVKINTSSVSVEQKAVAEKVGIDLDTIVITPVMVSCAEQKLGSARVDEIMNGVSPSTLEGILLFSCL